MGLSWGFRGASVGLIWAFHVAPAGAIMGLLCGFYGPRCGLYGNAGLLAVFLGSLASARGNGKREPDEERRVVQARR